MITVFVFMLLFVLLVVRHTDNIIVEVITGTITLASPGPKSQTNNLMSEV